MKRIFFGVFLFLSAANLYASKLDINIIYESSEMKVKETVCGSQPDLEKGFMEDGEGCFFTQYTLDVPMFGFVFEPKSGAVQDVTKCAYYISFFDAVTPKEGFVKTYIVSDGGVRKVDNLMHDRTFQGLLVLQKGETIRLATEPEPSYIYIYIIALAVLASGVYFIIRRKK